MGLKRVKSSVATENISKITNSCQHQNSHISTFLSEFKSPSNLLYRVTPKIHVAALSCTNAGRTCMKFSEDPQLCSFESSTVSSLIDTIQFKATVSSQL